jgi:transposase InsO family protein
MPGTPNNLFRLAIAAVAATAACRAFTPSSTRGPDVFETDVVSPRSASVRTLGRRDIAPYEGRPLAEALAQLRPDWLRFDPSARIKGEGRERPALYVNDIASGDITGLKTVASDAVVDVRLLSMSEAWARYGPSCRCPAGAILVRTRSNE